QAVRSARSSECVEDARRSLSVKEYESFIGKIGKPNPFALQLSRSRQDCNQGVTQQYSRLEILAAVKREGARDGDIDLASVTCLVQFDRIEIMECELYVRILQLVSANEVRQERERCRTDKPDRKPPTLPWAARLAVTIALS